MEYRKCCIKIYNQRSCQKRDSGCGDPKTDLISSCQNLFPIRLCHPKYEKTEHHHRRSHVDGRIELAGGLTRLVLGNPGVEPTDLLVVQPLAHGRVAAGRRRAFDQEGTELRAVADAISHEEVAKTVDIVIHDCQQKFGLSHPKILVCGLNPHAGESGYLGREEIDIINPVLQHYRDQGIDISLAMPADTLFTQKHIPTADAIIAMYHDQGLAPLKSHGFGETVNITLGLPYIRTSVDHGTALDLAGTGKASTDSLYHAIDYANNMATAIAL